MSHLVMTTIDETKGFVKGSAKDKDDRNLGNVYISKDALAKDKTFADVKSLAIEITYR